jgi:hypothetical protein
MITDRQKQSILSFIDRMPYNQVEWLNDFTHEEVDYIIHLMQYQTGWKGYIIESNGTETDRNSITKIRKIRKWQLHRK